MPEIRWALLTVYGGEAEPASWICGEDGEPDRPELFVTREAAEMDLLEEQEALADAGMEPLDEYVGQVMLLDDGGLEVEGRVFTPEMLRDLRE